MSERCDVCHRLYCRTLLGDDPHDFEQRARCWKIGYERLQDELAAAEERGRRRGVEERDELRDALTQLLVWADRVAPRAGVRMDDPNTGARELARTTLASGTQGVSFRGGSYFDSQQKEIKPCKHGEWPMACWECQSEYELAKTPEQRAQEHKLNAALAPRDSGPKCRDVAFDLRSQLDPDGDRK